MARAISRNQAASRSTDRRGLNAAACLLLLAAGVGLMASNQALLSTAGLVAILAALFLLVLLARPSRIFAALGTALVIAITVALAAAVWVQRDQLRAGASAVKSRLIRSGMSARLAACLVVPLRERRG